MTQQLIDKLIDHYTKAIERIQQAPNDLNQMQDILIEMRVYAGICVCSSRIFKEEVLFDPWIESFNAPQDAGMYWFGKTPMEGDTKSRIIDLLQRRVDRMRTFEEKHIYVTND